MTDFHCRCDFSGDDCKVHQWRKCASCGCNSRHDMGEAFNCAFCPGTVEADASPLPAPQPERGHLFYEDGSRYTLRCEFCGISSIDPRAASMCRGAASAGTPPETQSAARDKWTAAVGAHLEVGYALTPDHPQYAAWVQVGSFLREQLPKAQPEAKDNGWNPEEVVRESLRAAARVDASGLLSLEELNALHWAVMTLGPRSTNKQAVVVNAVELDKVFATARAGLDALADRDRLVKAGQRVVKAWERGWDCSADPGHGRVSTAMSGLYEALEVTRSGQRRSDAGVDNG